MSTWTCSPASNTEIRYRENSSTLLSLSFFILCSLFLIEESFCAWFLDHGASYALEVERHGLRREFASRRRRSIGER